MGHLTRRGANLWGNVLAVTTALGTMACPAITMAQQDAQPAQGASGTPINLSAVRVDGQAAVTTDVTTDDTIRAMRIDPDKDYSAVGKARVLTTSIDRATLVDRQIDNLQDFAARVDASINYSAGNSSINLRGLDQSRIETTIDGVRMPWGADGAYQGAFSGAQGGVSAYDFNAIGGVDIVKSADSSFFGTGALGGVVALRTLDPDDLLKDGKTIGGFSKVTYNSASDSFYLNQALAWRHKDTELLVEGGYADGDQTRNRGTVGGIGATRTETDPATYTQASVLAKLRQYLGNGQRLTLTGEWFDRKYDEQTLTSETSATDTVGTAQQNQRTRISLAYDYQASSPDAFLSEAHVLGYWQKVRTITDTRTYDSSNPTGYESNLEERIALPVQSYGGTASATFHVETGPIRHAVTLGGEVYITDTSESETGFHTDVPSYVAAYIHDNYADMPKTHGTDLGAVFQDRMSFAGAGWLHITPGLRYDYYRRTPRNSALYDTNPAYALSGLPAASHGTHVSPKVLIEAQAARALTLYALYSQAYRAPSANELYLDYNSYPAYAVLGDPTLKPESSKGWEVGAKYGTSERGLNVDFYDNYYRNFIDSATLGVCPDGVAYSYGCYGYVNLPNVRIYGADATGHWAFNDHWRTWVSLAYANGRNTDAGYNLASVVPFKGIVGVGYKKATWGVDGSTTFSAVRKGAEYLTLTGGTGDAWNVPAYAVFDLSAWIRPPFYKAMTIQGGLYNIGNKTYYNAAALPYGLSATTLSMPYYSQPGRTFKVTARVDF